MLIVIPVSTADQHLATSMLDLILKLGGVRPHKILLAFSQLVSSEKKKELEGVAAQCGELTSMTLKGSDERGWPRSANSIFSELAMHVHTDRSHGEQFWYFMEADNTPMCRDWADKLAAEYRLAKMPCMGAINKTMRGGGENRRQDGHHLVGTAIYPVDLWTRVRLCKHINMLPDPFDVAIQWEVVPISHNTELIQHNWSTCKYTKRGARVVCQSSTDRPNHDDYANPISQKAVVVHGCKDGSLAKLVEEAL